MDLRHLALVIWPLAWLGVLAAYAASALGGHLEACVPHLTGCASVSASGRHGAGFFVFKAAMMPVAVLFAGYWALAERWLRAAGDRAAKWRATMLACGLGGAAALVLYTTFLGSEGAIYRALRQYGTVLFFGLTFLAELLLVYRAKAIGGPPRLLAAKTALCVFMLIEGLALEALSLFVLGDAWLENVAEWHVASALTFYPALTWLLWRRTGFRIRYRVDDDWRRGRCAGLAAR